MLLFHYIASYKTLFRTNSECTYSWRFITSHIPPRHGRKRDSVPMDPVSQWPPIAPRLPYRHIRQTAIPSWVVLGTAVFCDQSNQYLVYEFPFCAMHMRVSSVSLPYLQNRLPSLIISAILAQYSSLCDHLVLQFNLGFQNSKVNS